MSTAPDGTTVRLDWDPPLDNGGVAITNYLISVNMSQQVFSTDTTTTFTLNSTGEHLIEISAVNNCGIIGDNVSAIVNITGISNADSSIHVLTLFPVDFANDITGM
jgi:hypothetical protein